MLPQKSWSPRPIFEQNSIALNKWPPITIGVAAYNSVFYRPGTINVG